MTTTFTGNDADGVTLTANGDLWIVSQFSFVTASFNAFDFAATNSNRLLVYGTVASEDDDAVNSNIGSFNLRVEVMPTGVVTGASDAIELTGTGHIIVNNGILNGLTDAGVQLLGGTNGTIVNNGAIFGARAVLAEGDNIEINNTGEITGGSVGIEMNATSGSILRNSGIIQAATGVSVFGDLDGTNIVQNSGQIFGTLNGVRGSNGIETLENFGLIVGNIALLGGADIVTNSGTIANAIDLGDGADSYTASGDGMAGAVIGGLGADMLFGGDRADSLSGGDDEDVLRGGDGNDVLDGGIGDDTLGGGNGNDELTSGDGDDTLRGGSGEDILFGDRNNDRLVGGSGNDTLDGGRNVDTLIGGEGSDTFVIGSVNGRDMILDFRDDVDRLDLSALGFATTADALANATTIDGNTVFAFGSNRVTILDISVNQIADDLLIASLDMMMPRDSAWLSLGHDMMVA